MQRRAGEDRENKRAAWEETTGDRDLLHRYRLSCQGINMSVLRLYTMFSLDSRSEDKASRKKRNGPQSCSENWDSDKLPIGTSSAMMTLARKASFGLKKWRPVLNVSKECARSWLDQERKSMLPHKLARHEQILLEHMWPLDTVAPDH